MSVGGRERRGMGRTIGGIASSSVATWRSSSSSFVLARQDIKVAKRDQLSLFPSFLEDTCLPCFWVSCYKLGRGFCNHGI